MYDLFSEVPYIRPVAQVDHQIIIILLLRKNPDLEAGG